MNSVSYVKGSSSITRLEVHVMFKTKYCHEVFDFKDFERRCREIFSDVAEKQKVIIEEIGFDKNHVHMVWLIRVYHSVAMLAKMFKGTSGRKLLQEFPEIKRKYFYGSGLWSGVIFGEGVGRAPEGARKYVREQGAKKQSTLDKFMPPVYSERSER
jgi:putative transposase